MTVCCCVLALFHYILWYLGRTIPLSVLCLRTDPHIPQRHEVAPQLELTTGEAGRCFMSSFIYQEEAGPGVRPLSLPVPRPKLSFPPGGGQCFPPPKLPGEVWRDLRGEQGSAPSRVGLGARPRAWDGGAGENSGDRMGLKGTLEGVWERRLQEEVPVSAPQTSKFMLTGEKSHTLRCQEAPETQRGGGRAEAARNRSPGAVWPGASVTLCHLQELGEQGQELGGLAVHSGETRAQNGRSAPLLSGPAAFPCLLCLPRPLGNTAWPRHPPAVYSGWGETRGSSLTSLHRRRASAPSTCCLTCLAWAPGSGYRTTCLKGDPYLLSISGPHLAPALSAPLPGVARRAQLRPRLPNNSTGQWQGGRGPIVTVDPGQSTSL